jgi:hypothetical protein
MYKLLSALGFFFETSRLPKKQGAKRYRFSPEIHALRVILGRRSCVCHGCVCIIGRAVWQAMEKRPVRHGLWMDRLRIGAVRHCSGGARCAAFVIAVRFEKERDNPFSTTDYLQAKKQT